MRCAAGMLAFTLVACRDPTEIVLDVRLVRATPSELHNVSIYVAPEPNEAEARVEGDFAAASTTAIAADGTIGSLGVTPPSGITTLAVVVVAGVEAGANSCGPQNAYAGCIVARRTTAYVEHQIVHVPIELDADCLNVPCDARSTCSRGSCIPSSAP
jgi:hypothetical protein